MEIIEGKVDCFCFRRSDSNIVVKQYRIGSISVLLLSVIIVVSMKKQKPQDFEYNYKLTHI